MRSCVTFAGQGCGRRAVHAGGRCGAAGQHAERPLLGLRGPPAPRDPTAATADKGIPRTVPQRADAADEAAPGQVCFMHCSHFFVIYPLSLGVPMFWLFVLLCGTVALAGDARHEY